VHKDFYNEIDIPYNSLEGSSDTFFSGGVMKKSILIVVFMVCLAPFAFANWVSLTGAPEGGTPDVTLLHTDSDGVTVTVDIS
jgi:hypothetical protein